MKKLTVFILILLLLLTTGATAKETVNADYYFYSRCTDCGAEASAEKELRSKLESAYPDSQININIYNVADEELNEKLKSEFFSRGISEEKLSIYPIVFIGDTVLIGEDYRNAFTQKSQSISVTELILTALSGFTGGISPCSLSLILMLLTQLIVDKKRALTGALWFIAGRGIIYVLVGTVLSQILTIANTYAVSGVIYALTVILCIVFAVLCFIDFINIKRGHAGRTILKLPARVKAFYEKRIEKTTRLAGAFVAGILVGVGEFMCTGQIFAVTVFNFFETGAYRLLAFLLYAVMMSIPALVVTLLIYKGKSYLAIAKSLSGKEHLVKLTLSVLFALFGVFCIWKIYF